MVNLIDLYKEKYYIPSAELADQAETNRLHLKIVSIVMFLFGVVSLTVVTIMHFYNGRDYKNLFIYCSVFTIASTSMYIYSKLIKSFAEYFKNSLLFK